MMVGYLNGMLGFHNLTDGSVVLDNSIDRNITIPGNNKSINSFLLKIKPSISLPTMASRPMILQTTVLSSLIFLELTIAKYKSIKLPL